MKENGHGVITNEDNNSNIFVLHLVVFFWLPASC